MSTDTSTTAQEGQHLEATPGEGHGPIPLGLWLLYGGLVAFGAVYLYAYTPSLGGWSQGAELARGAAVADGGGVSIAATIVFTALAAVTAVLLLGLSRRRRAR